MSWIGLTSSEDLLRLAETQNKSIIFFKHSTRCSISFMAKSRMEKGIDELSSWADVYLLDLIQYREVSNLIASKFGVRHESPQVLLVENGDCLYSSSHGGISPSDLKAYSKIN